MENYNSEEKQKIDLIVADMFKGLSIEKLDKKIKEYGKFVNDDLTDAKNGFGQWTEGGFYWGVIEDFCNDIFNRLYLNPPLLFLKDKGFIDMHSHVVDLDKSFVNNTLKIDKDVIATSELEALLGINIPWRDYNDLKIFQNRIPYNIDDDFKKALGDYKIIED